MPGAASSIILKTGFLYNAVACMIILVSASLVIAMVFHKRKSGFSALLVFLALVAASFAISGIINFFGWLNIKASFALLLFAPRALMLFAPVAVFTFVCGALLKDQRQRASSLYFSWAAAFLIAIALLLSFGNAKTTLSYWGLGLTRPFAPEIMAGALFLLPAAAASIWLAAARRNEKKELLLWLSVLGLVLLNTHDLAVTRVGWETLVIRLFYIVSFFCIGLSAGEEKREDFVSISSREALEIIRKKPRVPFFLKLLGVFLLLSVIPIAVFGMLMFATFKEIIDLYIYKPLLWNLKTSRQEFLFALKNIQVQLLFLLGLTLTVVLMASSIISRMISGELKRVGSGMKRISEGDLSVKIAPSSNDEIGDLVAYFDVMAEEIKAARERLENFNRELEREVDKRTRELREAMERLMELDKLKTQFISMVSHELRTPLTSINGFTAQFIEGKTGKMNEVQLRFLGIMKDSEKRLLGLIDGLLDFANMESGRFKVEKSPQMIDLIIRGAVDSVKDLLEEKGVKVELKAGAKDGRFLGDESRIKQVLLNLIDNAAKFSPENPLIEISSAVEGDDIVVRVKDNGVGIAGDRMNKIFEKFYQTDTSFTRKFGGVGLGLTIAKEIIEAHGGKIRAQSEGPGHGSVFSFFLPLSR